MNNLFFYVLSVSKSLLIVLGTLPLPALNGRGKSIHHPINSLKNRPISCFHNPIFNGAGRAGIAHTARLPSIELSLLGYGINMVFFRFLVNCTVMRFALVKAMDYLTMPALAHRQKLYLSSPAILVSLDNSYPLNSQGF